MLKYKFLFLFFCASFFSATICLGKELFLMPDDTTAQSKQDTTVWKQVGLDEVEIKASNIIQRGDETRVVITKEMRRGAKDVAQMMATLPGFDYDYIDRQLKYHNSTNIVVLVDSVEKSKNNVMDLFHLRFDKIDIIDHPQGKYAGYDVLINFHTKKNYEGYEGNISYYSYQNPSSKNSKFLVACVPSGYFSYTKNRWSFYASDKVTFQQGGIDRRWQRNNYLAGIRDVNIPNENGNKDMTQYDRLNNFYASADYKISDKSSVSFVYSFSNDNFDERNENTYIRTTDADKDGVVQKRYDNLAKDGQEHSWAVFYRGKKGKLDYSADFNYRYLPSEYASNRIETSGFMLDNHFRDRMNYTRFRAEASSNFLNYTLFISGGYANTWKDYSRRGYDMRDMLNANSYYRNKVWAQVSYWPWHNTNVKLGGWLEQIHLKSNGARDNQLPYGFNALFYQKLSPKNWLRMNYNCNINYPDQTASSSYGYFVDSLIWSGGNPFLRSSVRHDVRLTVDLWQLLNLQVGYVNSPNTFANISEEREGMLPSGVEGKYVAKTTVNAKYDEWWAAVSFTKRFCKDFVYKADIKYIAKNTSYSLYSRHADEWYATTSLRYYNDKMKMSVLISYLYNQGQNILPQSFSELKYDITSLYVEKFLMNQNLILSFGYEFPFCFAKGTNYVIEDSPLMYVSNVDRLYERIKNGFRINVVYRFQGGKSVRKYNKELSSER